VKQAYPPSRAAQAQQQCTSAVHNCNNSGSSAQVPHHQRQPAAGAHQTALPLLNSTMFASLYRQIQYSWLPATRQPGPEDVVLQG
jgi:hypothetical protein